MGFVGLKTDLHWQGWVCFCRAKAATYTGRVGFGFVGLNTDLHWQSWVCFCRAKAATYIGRVGFVFVGLKPRLAFNAGSFKKGVEGSAKKEKWLPELDLNQ